MSRAILVASSILVASAVWPRASVAADIPARVLRSVPLVTPAELVGSDLKPEVSVKFTIDARGRVSEVTVVEISPSSDLDPVLRELATENLLEWRFAPARRDGTAVESTLGWRVQFHGAGQEGDSGGTTDLFAAMLEDPRASRAQLSDLPKDERGEMLDRYARIAEKSLDRSKRRRVDSPRFVVISDAGSEETAQALANNLEAVFNVLHGIFDAHVAPEPQPLKLVVYLFASRLAFDAVRDELGVHANAAGFYGAPGFLAFHSEVPTPQDLLSTMLHETVHAYSDAHLRRAGMQMPMWMEEGLAEYFGNSGIQKKQLVPGKTLRGSFVNTHYGGIYRISSERWTADNVRRTVRAGKAPSLEDVLQASYPVFYGEDSHLYYALSWMLVHFLRHGEPTWADTKFPELMLYMAEGYDADIALRTVYGIPDAELAARFEKYVRTF